MFQMVDDKTWDSGAHHPHSLGFPHLPNSSLFRLAKDEFRQIAAGLRVMLATGTKCDLEARECLRPFTTGFSTVHERHF